MSFVGKRSINSEIALKEKSDENLKTTINDKILEIIAKNNNIKEKIEKINRNNYFLKEDEDYLEEKMKDIKQTIDDAKNLIKDFENLINRKYSDEIDMRDKLNLIKQQIIKTYGREFENFQKNFSNFNSIKLNMMKKTEIEDAGDNDGLLHDLHKDQKRFKVDDGQIKYLHDVSEFRKNKMENIYTKTLYVQKITEDINQLTRKQENQIEKIADNVDPVVYNAKDTFVSLLQASAEDKNFKNNNCFITMIITFGLFFLMLVLINWNR